MNDWPQEECDQVTYGQVCKNAAERYKESGLSEKLIMKCVEEVFERMEKPPKNPDDGVGSSRGYWLLIIPAIHKKVCEHTGRQTK